MLHRVRYLMCGSSTQTSLRPGFSLFFSSQTHRSTYLRHNFVGLRLVACVPASSRLINLIVTATFFHLNFAAVEANFSACLPKKTAPTPESTET